MAVIVHGTLSWYITAIPRRMQGFLDFLSLKALSTVLFSNLHTQTGIYYIVTKLATTKTIWEMWILKNWDVETICRQQITYIHRSFMNINGILYSAKLNTYADKLAQMLVTMWHLPDKTGLVIRQFQSHRYSCNDRLYLYQYHLHSSDIPFHSVYWYQLIQKDTLKLQIYTIQNTWTIYFYFKTHTNITIPNLFLLLDLYRCN